MCYVICEGGLLKDSNYCFDSLAIRLRSKDLKTPHPRNLTPDYRVRTVEMQKLDLFWNLARF